MNVYEAEKQGLLYTGMSWPAYNPDKGERYKAEVQEYRKTYRVRFVKVKTHDGWYSYYASKGYWQVMYGEKDLNKINANHQERLAALKAKYENAIEEETQKYEYQLDEYNKLKSLEK